MFLDFLFQGAQRKYKKYLADTITSIKKIEETYTDLTLADLPNKTLDLKTRFAEAIQPNLDEKIRFKQELEEAKLEGNTEGIKKARFSLNQAHKKFVKREKEILDELLPEGFALVRTACKLLIGKSWEVRGNQKTWDMVPYDVQLEGGIVLHDGKIAEMKTGEGKTLVCVAPLFLHAITGRGSHLVTVNEYLAKRDKEWMSGVYEALGLSSGVVYHGLDFNDRKAEYAKDITYTTNNELGFDYLRDNMAGSPEQMVQQDLSYAVIDEVDSILIDEARTPLIISAPSGEATEKYNKYATLVKKLEKEKHFLIDEKQKTAVLTEEGITKMEELLGVQNIYTDAGVLEVHHIEQALKATFIFEKDKDYVIKDDEVIIVDEFTGRLMQGRRYSEGLHQAIEAKEGVPIQKESKTLATVTFQNFFRLYDHFAGMTGTAKTEEEEFQKIYGLDVQVISTKNPLARIDKPDAIFKTVHGKYNAIAKIVKEKHELGQPCLVGTVSIEQSEMLSRYFDKAGIPYNILNAKNHEREAEIVASAGEKGAVTIATNMAGRGTDIKITDEVKALGGLAVIGSERHESRRIDNQLRGRSGRQGDPGESQFFVSMEDSLMRVFGGDTIKSVMAMLKIPEDMPIENKTISNSLEKAQTRVEAHHFDIRKHVVEYDNVMNKHREILYSRRRDLLFSDNPTGTIREMFHTFVLTLNPFDTPENNADKLVPLLPEDRDSLIKFVSDELPERLQDKISEKLWSFYESKWKVVPESEKKRIEKTVALQIVDSFWMDHIDDMMRLREHVAYRGYAQKDPLGEYRREGFEKFDKLLNSVSSTTVQTLCQLELVPKMQIENNTPDLQNLITNDEKIEEGLDTNEYNLDEKQVIKLNSLPNDVSSDETNRNDPCPCGSGKKYKKCHGK